MREVLTIILATLAVTPAWAVTGLKQVQVSNGSQVDLLFDSKVSKNQIRTEFFNDVIQVSLTDTSVYPAKILSVNGGLLQKVFAYQYAPKLVRCRLTVKGKAESFKDRIDISPGGPNGKMLTIRLDGAVDKVQLNAAQANHVAAPRGDQNAKIDDPEERSLLERVMKGPGHVSVQAPLVAAAGAKDKKEENKEEKSLTSGKPMISPLRAFGKLALVVGLFALIAFAARKLARDHSGLSRLAKKHFGKKGKMIEVVATHYLGPKKSIAVVKIAGRMLVLGISNESINLITQLANDGTSGESALNMEISELEELGLQINTMDKGAGAVSAGPPVFADLLGVEAKKPAMTAPVNNSPLNAPPVRPATQNGVRAQIRSRLEGMKPL